MGVTTGEAFAAERRTVTVLVRTATGNRDDYGNPTWESAEVDVPDCLVAPGSSSDDQSDAERTTTTVTVYDLAGTWPGGTVNRVRLDGGMWEIVGQPARWPGAIGGTVVELRRVEG